MNYKKTTKIIVDKRKLDLLIRIGCPNEQIIQVMSKGTFTKTGDALIDDTLECFADFKDFTNWGGKREGAGRKPDNQDENQDDLQLDNQDGGQDVDKDKDIYNNILIKEKEIAKKKKVLINEGFNFGDCKEVHHIANKYDIGTLDNVQRFLLQKFNGQYVDVEFIDKMADKFSWGETR